MRGAQGCPLDIKSHTIIKISFCLYNFVVFIFCTPSLTNGLGIRINNKIAQRRLFQYAMLDKD